MKNLSYRTISANKATARKNWVLVNAENQTLGRLASGVAKMIRGKNKTNYTPHVDCGDNVIVVNAEKVIFSGKKWDQKEYVHYTEYPGGQRFITPRKLVAKKPTAIVEMAVRGMLPKNKIGAAMYKNLYVYAGKDHPHEAQQPVEFKFEKKTKSNL